jgi:outer membrane protein assembly factor BamB
MVAGGNVIYRSANGWIEAFSQATGERSWQIDLGRPSRAVRLDPDDLIASSDTLVYQAGNELRAASLTSGEALWSITLEERASISLVEDTVYLVNAGAVNPDVFSLRAIDATSGSTVFDTAGLLADIREASQPVVTQSWVVIEARVGRTVQLIGLL